MKHFTQKHRPCLPAWPGLALAFLWALAAMLHSGSDQPLFAQCAVSFLAWCACQKAVNGKVKRTDWRLTGIGLFLGALFSGMMVLGSNVMRFETADLLSLHTWLRLLCSAPMYAAISIAWIRLLPRFPMPRFAWIETRARRLSSRSFFMLCWAMLFLSWLPGLIAAYPGVYAYDCPYQLRSYLSGAITTHHPIAHTGWLALCVVELGGLLGSLEAGMCIYSVSQMLLFASAHASVLSCLRRRGISGTVLVCVLLLFMFLPPNAIFSFSGTKDVAFASFVVWTLIALLDVAHSPALLRRGSFWLRFSAASFGMMVFRNQGVYVFIFAMVAALLIMKGNRRRVLALLMTVMLLFGAYQGPLTEALGVQKANAPQEMLSVPIMQLARVRQYYQHQLSDQDAEAIADYIPDWDNYSSISCAISDPVKNTFDNGRFLANPAAFLKLWARTGLQYPAAYIDAFLRLTAGYWYPAMPYRDEPAYQPYFQYEYLNVEDAPVLKRSTPNALAWLHEWYMDLSVNTDDQKYSVFSLVISAGLAAWMLLLFMAWAVYERRWRMLWPGMLLFGLWGTILLGPVVLMRYALPLIMAEPLLIGEIWTCYQNKSVVQRTAG